MQKRRPRNAEEVLDEQLARNPDLRERWERTAPARVVADALVRYRVDHGLSQTQLAKRLGTSQSVVAKWESGEHNPSWDSLLLLRDKLGIIFVFGTLPNEHVTEDHLHSPPILAEEVARLVRESRVEHLMSPAAGTRAFAASTNTEAPDVVKV